METVSKCCLDVGPVLPKNFVGTINITGIVDDQEASFSGSVRMILKKAHHIEYAFDAQAATNGSVSIPVTLEDSAFFSDLYSNMEFHVRNAATYKSLYFKDGDELYDCLRVKFGPEDCDLPVDLSITYSPELVACPIC